ncbi:MAG: hypothetical protein R2706_11710 [Acidimicrobiales bacterium]
MEFGVVHEGTTYESKPCPDTLLAFPASIDQRQNFGGFVCFAHAAEGGEFGVYVGSNVLTELKVRPSYKLADGTVIEPSE